MATEHSRLCPYVNNNNKLLLLLLLLLLLPQQLLLLLIIIRPLSLLFCLPVFQGLLQSSTGLPEPDVRVKYNENRLMYRRVTQK